MWNIQNILLLSSGIINLAMSIFIISRGWKNKVNLYFSLLTFFNFTWSLGLFISRFVIDHDITSIFSRSAYISALLIVVSLFYFTFSFPYKIHNLGIIKKMLIWLPVVFFLCVIYTDFFIINIVTAYSEYEYIVYFNMIILTLYILYFIFISFLAIHNLIIKYIKAENIFQRQIIFLLMSIIIGLVFGSFFDLFLPFYKNFKYNWLGPIFTLPMNFTAFYLIKSPKKDI